MAMRHVILLILLAISCAGCSQQTITTFILSRHAEKGDDGTKDPDLTPAGYERAQALRRLLSRASIDAVYSTAFKRTRNTVLPLAQEKSLTILEYEPAKTEEIDKMLAKYPGGTVVICGHSNTIPSVINYLTGRDEYKNFADSDYGNLIVVTIVEKGKLVSVTRLNY